MIISASYKTDIPAFYGDWFKSRLRAGYCRMLNPYSRKPITVDLSERGVDGFVFWTKNLGPFFSILDEVRARGFPFTVQYSITSYPKSLESSVIDSARSIAHLHQLRDAFGARVGVWRYDTIVFTSETPAEFHLSNFERIAADIEGATDEVVVSFAQIYRKTKRNMDSAAEKHGLRWFDPSDDVKRELAAGLARIARTRGMQLTMCSQRSYLAEGIDDARCIDIRRLSDVAGRPILGAQKGNRPECGCHSSRDIGDYDTCPHGCVYCYAVRDKALAQRRYRACDPAGEFLVPPDQPCPHLDDSDKQLRLL